MIFDSSGALYGTTDDGPLPVGRGTVFKLTAPAGGGAPWNEAILYTFTGGTDGLHPDAGMFDTSGALYGTTNYGGAYGFGTAFKLTPLPSGVVPWRKHTIYDFKGGMDGDLPNSILAFGPQGALYGATVNGGASGYGTLFQIAPPREKEKAWTEAVLYSFPGGTGAANPGSVTFGPKGALYGIAGGGTTGLGTIFRFALPKSKAPGSAAVLYSFKGQGDSANPAGGVVFSDEGKLYGTTSSGGAASAGTAYELTLTK